MIWADYSDRLPKDFNLYLKGDDHIGSAACSFKTIQAEVKIIVDDPIGWWMHLGDAAESIYVDDPRFSLALHGGRDALVNDQVNRWFKLHEPAIPKLLAILDGNHEDRLKNTVDIVRLISDKIKDRVGIDIDYGGYTIVARLSKKFKLFATHGSRQVESQAGELRQRQVNEEIRVKRLLRDLRGDCKVMAMGHIHKMRICPPSYDFYLAGEKKFDHIYPEEFVSSEGIIHPDSRWYCSTGSAAKIYIDVTTWAETRMFKPAELGMIKIEVRDGRVRDVRKEIIRA